MNGCLTLKFPFSFIKDKKIENRIQIVEATVERSLSIVSFSLIFNAQLSISNAKMVSFEKTSDGFIYVFEFESIEDTLEWMNNKEVNVSYKTVDVYTLQNEMNEMMLAYEKKENKKRKKMVDEDGFEYYE